MTSFKKSKIALCTKYNIVQILLIKNSCFVTRTDRKNLGCISRDPQIAWQALRLANFDQCL